MAGEHFGFVRQGQQAGLDGLDNLVVVSARQVSASDASGKQGVSGDEQLEGDEVEAD